jgi:hypothetical protein
VIKGQESNERMIGREWKKGVGEETEREERELDS